MWPATGLQPEIDELKPLLRAAGDAVLLEAAREERLLALSVAASASTQAAKKKRRKKRGRKPKYSAQEDRKLVERWTATGMTKPECEREWGLDPGDIEKACDRERKRRK